MKRLRYIIIAIIGALLISTAIMAGGPWMVNSVDNNGKPLAWFGNKVTWYTDSGALLPDVDNATAVSWVTAGFARWGAATIKDKDGKDVSAVSFTSENKGSVGFDINETNYGTYWSSSSGPTVIIFDSNGKILKELLGGDGFVGLTHVPISDKAGRNIIKGTVIISGKAMLDNQLSDDEVKAIMFHEIGHLLNLDHSQVNMDIADECELGESCDMANRIPAMYPELKTSEQMYPSYDDIISLARIYPSADFGSKFATITGQILDPSGKPLQGVHVVAFRYGDGDDNARKDARGSVSGGMYGAGYADGHYYLSGIRPGKQYRVFYEPIGGDFTGPSDFQPLGENSPSGFDPAYIYSKDDDEIVSADNGGDTITMKDVKIGSEQGTQGNGDAGAETKSDGGGCSLRRR